MGRRRNNIEDASAEPEITVDTTRRCPFVCAAIVFAHILPLLFPTSVIFPAVAVDQFVPPIGPRASRLTSITRGRRLATAQALTIPLAGADEALPHRVWWRYASILFVIFLGTVVVRGGMVSGVLLGAEP